MAKGSTNGLFKVFVKISFLETFAQSSQISSTIVSCMRETHIQSFHQNTVINRTVYFWKGQLLTMVQSKMWSSMKVNPLYDVPKL
uniref:Uncharacterized protein n=1 Tax=Romanomermis culicivorax TaxID=13658 RepID=A0A915JDA4_ROMCU